MECVFCKIIEGELDRELISKTENTLTILSNPSQIEGHCLVIPKRHVEKISELNNKEKKEIFSELIKIEEILLRKFSGCDIKQNYRPFIPNSKFKVSHLHFHVQPRELNDNLFEKVQVNEKDVFNDLSKEELKKIKEEIFENGT